jgi:uncharacterized protein YkwD
MKYIPDKFRYVLLVLLVSIAILGCNITGISILFSTPNGIDPSTISLQVGTRSPLISPTILIFSPTPSLTGTSSQTASFTLLASYTPNPSATYSPVPSQTSTYTSTRTSFFTRTASLTRIATYLASITRSNTWTFSWTANLIATWTPSITVFSSVSSPTSAMTPTLSAPTEPLPPDSTETPTQSDTSISTLASDVTSTISPTSVPSLATATTATVKPTSIPSPINSGCNIVYNDAYELQVITLVNNERAKVGLPALSMNSSLMTSAGSHSDDMALNNYMSHTGSDGSTAWQRMQRAGYVGRWGGENIWVGYSSGTPADAMTWWMNDAPHRDNILGQYYKDIGVGYAYCATGTYRHYYTIDFGAP